MKLDNKGYTEDQILKEYLLIVKKLNSNTTKLGIDILLEIKFGSQQKTTRYQLIVEALQFEIYLEKKSFAGEATKMKTMQKLQQLDLKSLDAKILPFAYSKNQELRREARFSHLHLSDNDPYRFLDEIKGDLTYWEEINLLKLLRIHNEKNKLSNLGKWINYSHNTSLIVFLIKAAGFFEQQDTKEVLSDKIESENFKVRAEVYTSLGKLHATEYETRFMKEFFNEREECQIAIVKSIGLMNTGKAVDFLRAACKDAKTTALKKEIALVSFSYKSKYNLFHELKTSQIGFDQTIFDHVETQLIKFK